MSNFGVDLVLESQKANIKNKNDVLIVLMHWMLCKNNMRNVGVGDNKIYNEEDRASELLPEGWNEEVNSYRLRYTSDKKVYILYGSVTGDSLLINLLDAESKKTESLIMETDQIVKAVKGVTLDDFVTDSETLFKRIKEEIVDPVFKKAEVKKDEPTRSVRVDNPLLVRPGRHRTDDDGILYPIMPDDLRDIGRGDLDPFGRGGGMIFQPAPFGPGGIRPLGGFHPRVPGGLPPGVPPGARFDPINPLRRQNPDPDHFAPPGNPPFGYDDMFM